jgi:hypothetical protein
VSYSLEPAGRLSVDVMLRGRVTGEFHWRGTKRELPPGSMRFIA